MLRQSYAPLLQPGGLMDASEIARWEQYATDIRENPATVGACIFLTCLDGQICGFGSWDPRPDPVYGRASVGHNCILPEYRQRGLGRRQISEILDRLRRRGACGCQVTTGAHPFYLPARKMYESCGFRRADGLTQEPDIVAYAIDFHSKSFY